MRLLLLLAVLGQWAIGQGKITSIGDPPKEKGAITSSGQISGPKECPTGKMIVYTDHRFKCIYPPTKLKVENLPSKTHPALADPCAAQRPGDRWYSPDGGNGEVGGDCGKPLDFPNANLIRLSPPTSESYNFILPQTIPGNGLYTCKIKAHVLEIVGERKPSREWGIVALSLGMGILAGIFIGIMSPPLKKKEIAQ